MTNCISAEPMLRGLRSLLSLLLRTDLHRIFAEAGIQDIRFSFTGHGGIPKLPKVTWQQVSMGLMRGCLFSDNLLIEASLPK